MPYIMVPARDVQPPAPTVHKSCCPVHGARQVRRAIVHAKGCPGFKGDCVDTCHPKHWHYCLGCTWRMPYSCPFHVARNPRLPHAARLGLIARRLRSQAGIGQPSVALRLRCTPSTIQLWECGGTVPSEALMQEALDYLRSLVDQKPAIPQTDPFRAFVAAAKKARGARGLSLLEAAQKSGVYLRKLVDFEFDAEPLGPEDMKKLCWLLHLEVPNEVPG